MSFIFDVEGVFHFSFVDESEVEFIGMVDLVDVHPHILDACASFEPEGEGACGRGVAGEVIASEPFPFPFNADEVYFGQEVKGVQVVHLVGAQPEELSFLEFQVFVSLRSD